MTEKSKTEKGNDPREEVFVGIEVCNTKTNIIAIDQFSAKGDHTSANTHGICLDFESAEDIVERILEGVRQITKTLVYKYKKAIPSVQEEKAWREKIVIRELVLAVPHSERREQWDDLERAFEPYVGKYVRKEEREGESHESADIYVTEKFTIESHMDLLAKLYFENKQSGIVIQLDHGVHYRYIDEEGRIKSPEWVPQVSGCGGGSSWIARTAFQVLAADIENNDKMVFKRQEHVKRHKRTGKVLTIEEFEELKSNNTPTSSTSKKSFKFFSSNKNSDKKKNESIEQEYEDDVREISVKEPRPDQDLITALFVKAFEKDPFDIIQGSELSFTEFLKYRMRLFGIALAEAKGHKNNDRLLTEIFEAGSKALGRLLEEILNEHTTPEDRKGTLKILFTGEYTPMVAYMFHELYQSLSNYEYEGLELYGEYEPYAAIGALVAAREKFPAAKKSPMGLFTESITESAYQNHPETQNPVASKVGKFYIRVHND